MTPGGEDPPDTATMGPNPDSPSLPAIPLDDIQGTLHRWLVDATGADFDGLKGLNQRFSQAYRQAYNSRPVIENSENGPLDLEPLSPLIREVNEYALRRVLSHWNVLHRLSNEFGVALEIDQRTLSSAIDIQSAENRLSAEFLRICGQRIKVALGDVSFVPPSVIKSVESAMGNAWGLGYVSLGLTAEHFDGFVQTYARFWEHHLKWNYFRADYEDGMAHLLGVFSEYRMDIEAEQPVHFPGYVQSAHHSLGLIHTADEYLDSIASALRCYGDLFGGMTGRIATRQWHYLKEIRDFPGFSIALGRGEYEADYGVACTLRRRNSVSGETAAVAKVQWIWTRDGQPLVVNIQSDNDPIARQALRERLGVKSELDAALVATVLMAKNLGYKTLYGIDDTHQTALRDDVNQKEERSVYSARFARFGFAPPSESIPTWSLDLTTLPLITGDMTFASNGAADYVARVLARRIPGNKIDYNQWAKTGANPPAIEEHGTGSILDELCRDIATWISYSHRKTVQRNPQLN